MRKPRSRWRERARAWKRRGHLSLRPWSGDSGALLVCGFVLEPLGRTTLSPRRVAARSPLGSEADQRVGGRANSIVQAQPPPRLPPLQARLRPGRAPHPGGRREVTGHAEQARGHVAGVRRLYGARHAVVPSARGRGVRWEWRRQRRIVGVPWPTPAAGLLGSRFALGLSIGSARVATRPSTLARI